MSDTGVIKDRPLPFEVKTALLQLSGIAIGTPNEVADMSVKIDTIINISVNVRIYPGGYSGETKVFDETAYLTGKTTADAVKELEELIAKVNGVLAEGRKVRLAALKKKAAEIQREADELEQTLNRMESADVESADVAPIA